MTMARTQTHPETYRKGIRGKICTRCEKWKPLDSYYVVNSRGKPWRMAKCKQCQSDISQDWIARNYDKHLANMKAYNKRTKRPQALMYLYGLTVADYDRMVKKQRGKCLICQKKPLRLVVDHCHDTGTVRGLLCDLCNKGIGALHDDAVLVQRAADYLLGQVA